MNFTEAVDAVIDITARPDRRTETANAVNAILSLCVSKAEFARDLVEGTLAVDPTLYGATVSIATLTRFRKFKYLKITGERGYLTPTGADKIFTPGGSMQPNRYYVAGTNITYTLSKLTPTLEYGYYEYAPVLLDNAADTHWMLDVMPWAIIDLAASKIFRSIGDDGSYRIYQGTGQDLYNTARRDHQDAVLFTGV